MKLTAYTDGACSANGTSKAKAGWAFVLLDEDENLIAEGAGGVDNGTNNIGELTAIIKAIEAAAELSPEKLEIFSDSAYVVNAITNKWFINWERNGWLTSQNKPVKNKDLWLKLMKAMEEIEIKFSKVKGHAGEEFNEIADKLAVKATNDISEEKISIGRVYDVSSPEDR